MSTIKHSQRNTFSWHYKGKCCHSNVNAAWALESELINPFTAGFRIVLIESHTWLSRVCVCCFDSVCCNLGSVGHDDAFCPTGARMDSHQRKWRAGVSSITTSTIQELTHSSHTRPGIDRQEGTGDPLLSLQAQAPLGPRPPSWSLFMTLRGHLEPWNPRSGIEGWVQRCSFCLF